ncbi:MAG: Alcohol dehydrogenase GroES domain protein, partial [Nitrospira sp.]|nr:Alcohol dehydrogenase GroES domain protein [Nitrospira sp.]
AASRLGAHQTILTQPDGRPASAPDRSLDLLISTVPSQLPWEAYVELVRPGGALTFVGVPPGPATLPLDAMILQRRRLLTSSIAGRPMIRETLEVAARIGVRPTVESFPLTDVNQAIRRLRENRVRYRAVLMVE